MTVRKRLEAVVTAAASRNTRSAHTVLASDALEEQLARLCIRILNARVEADLYAAPAQDLVVDLTDHQRDVLLARARANPATWKNTRAPREFLSTHLSKNGVE